MLENVENKDISALINQRDVLGTSIIQKVTPLEMPIGSRSVYHFLQVAHVQNEVSPQGVQICWAACIASKVMYQTNYRNLTAMSVFDKCWKSVDNSPYDIPYGVDSWYNNAAALYGISLRIQDSLGSKEITSNALKNGKPIILSITDNDISHAVILCGIDEDASYMEFILMDPDTSGYVYVSLPNNIFSNSNQFCYAASYGRTFTKVTKFRY